MIEDNEQLFDGIQQLVEAWCDRHCLGALRRILPAYPLSSPLTDGWGDLLLALQNVRAFAKHELTADEQEMLDDCIRAVDSVVHRDWT